MPRAGNHGLKRNARATAAGVAGRRPLQSQRLRESGWILLRLEAVFAWLNRLSLSRWLTSWIRREERLRPYELTAHDRHRIDVREARCVDTYVALTTALLVAMLVLTGVDRYWVRLIAVVVSVYIVAELLQRTVSVVLFDHLRGHPPVANIHRSLVLGLINLAQATVGFAVLYAVWVPHRITEPDVAKTALARVPDATWTSLKTVALMETPDGMTGFEWLIPAAEILLVMWLLLVLVAWAIGSLPRRS